MDRRFSREIARLEVGGPFRKRNVGGGEGSRIGEFGGGGAPRVRKKISRFEICRGWYLCVLIILQTIPVIKDCYFILNVSKCKCVNSKNTPISNDC